MSDLVTVPAPQDFLDGLRDSGVQDQGTIDALAATPLTADQWADLCDCIFGEDDDAAGTASIVE